MTDINIINSFFLIFSGAALFASFALYTRQPLLIAYIVLGAVIGPYGFNYVNDPDLLAEFSKIGIIFLLFLLGLDMQPKNLATMLQKATLVALGSSAVFLAIGYSVGVLADFSQRESIIIGVAMMFSSTIIGIKLLPTTVLHHKHTGELVVGLLLLQDLIAIIVLLILGGHQNSNNEAPTLSVVQFLITMVNLPLLIIFAFFSVRIVLLRVIRKFDRFHEFIFLVAIGWCLGIAELAHYVGLSHEIGAFIAGISLATSPISLYIAEHLKPLRDFFLILFFFSLGASFNLSLLAEILIPSLILAFIVLLAKPVTFHLLLKTIKEPPSISWEVGVRLGQISEFSLLIAFLATSTQLISESASTLIQATAIITFLVNSYMVIFRYPSPIAISDKLRRD
ncbi:MAG: cation:proton antiporter [Hahellaceae bacterium]|jgi:Kef-type K+ transport system membrane component KefB|nr:cation:proton antiporter [Hahellaceae bacterium]MCP5212887.1 cation:proton antiporter [Hahellaceae bacterium]